MGRTRLAALLIATLLGATAAVAAGSKAAPSTVTLAFAGSDYGDAMTGSVGSPNRRCRAGRAITLFRVQPGPDQAYTATSSAAGGHFRLTPKGQVFPRGDYYARAARRVLRRKPKRRVCAIGQSPPVSVARLP